jgi:O-antigen/teichoic acid export membrane protein
MESNHHRSFLFDASVNFVTKILIFGISAVTSVIIARVLGPKGKGIYALIIMIPTMAATLSSMGINFSNIYFIGKKKYPIGLIIGNSLFFSFCFGGVATLLLFILAPFMNNYFLKGSAPLIYLYISLPMIPFLLLFENIYHIFLGYRNMLKFAAVNLVIPLSYLATLLFFYYFSKLYIYQVIWSYIFALGIGLSAGVYFLVQSGYCTGLAVNKKIFSESLSFGFKQHLGTVSQFLNYRFDLLIVAALLSPAEVGLYFVAVLVAETIWYIPNSLSQILYAQTASSDTQTANAFTPLVCRSTVLLTFIAVLVLFSISGIVIPWLFKSQFLPSVIALKLLLPGIFSLSISKVLGSDLVGRGFPQYTSFASFISLVLTVILDLILIPYFGIRGASLVSTVAYSANAVIVLYLFIRTTKVRLFDILVIKKADFVYYLGMFRRK